MNIIDRIIKKYQMMVLDGAFATELERLGCDLNDPLWSAKVLIESPDLIAKVHRMYFEAGADCAITASYQATYEGIMAKGFSEEEAAFVLKQSVVIAKDTRDKFWEAYINTESTISRPKPLVVASVGPYGAYLADGSEYRGDYQLDMEGLMAFHEKRLVTLIEAGPDILGIETIPCLAEAQALVKVLAAYPDMGTWVSFSAKDGKHINSGETIKACAAWLDDYPQVYAIGINCTNPIYVLSLIEEIKSVTDKPIVVYPNTGEIYDPEHKEWHGCHISESYAASAELWFEKGARLIGGCCRTTPDDIRNIYQWVKEFRA